MGHLHRLRGEMTPRGSRSGSSDERWSPFIECFPGSPQHNPPSPFPPVEKREQKGIHPHPQPPRQCRPIKSAVKSCPIETPLLPGIAQGRGGGTWELSMRIPVWSCSTTELFSRMSSTTTCHAREMRGGGGGGGGGKGQEEEDG